jgi:large subunit ribosomal protein L9
MKVLLCKDIEKRGWFGDVVRVSDGYARNCLLPQGLAVVPTAERLKAVAAETAMRAGERAKEKQRLEKTAVAVNGAEAVIAAKANEQGQLFGSVGSRQIAANLRAQGFEVQEKQIKLPENIKQVGTYSVELEFAGDMDAAVTVIVVAEQPDQEQVK